MWQRATGPLGHIGRHHQSTDNKPFLISRLVFDFANCVHKISHHLSRISATLGPLVSLQINSPSIRQLKPQRRT